MTTAAGATTEAQKDARRIVARAGIVGLGTLASRVLGLGRDMALAALFSRAVTDAFFVAFTIPNMLRQLLGEGAVSSAVVPVLTQTLERDGEERGRAFFRHLEGVWILALAVVSALGIALARPLCHLFAEGQTANPEQFERTVLITRIVFPYIFFMGLAALGMAVLHAHRRFAVAAFAPGLLNVAFLLGAFLLPAPLRAAGIDVGVALAISALVGGALQVVAQWPALAAVGYLKVPRFEPWDEGVREVFRRIGPMTFGIGVYAVDLVLSRRFLSELGTGAQSYFTWASRICDLPQGIFSLALSTAALPTLATLFARGERDELGRVLAKGLRLSLFVAVPCAVALVVLREPLLALLFQRGHFDATAVHETGRALAFQGIGIVSVAVVRQVVPVFHSMGNTRTPVLVSALDLVVFIVLAVTLKGPLGHAGVSAAVMGASFVQMALLVFLLRRKGPATVLEGVGPSLGRTVVASMVAAGAAVAVARLTSGLGGAIGRAVPGFAGGCTFVAFFLVAAWGVRSAELETLLEGIRRRLRGRRGSVLTPRP